MSWNAYSWSLSDIPFIKGMEAWPEAVRRPGIRRCLLAESIEKFLVCCHADGLQKVIRHSQKGQCQTGG